MNLSPQKQLLAEGLNLRAVYIPSEHSLTQAAMEKGGYQFFTKSLSTWA